ncbi:MAG: N-acetylmuramoyl-L-alanine amidase [Syntrophobacteraceae bacterium]
MGRISPLFRKLAETYAFADIEFPVLKAITLAQWLVESSRDLSPLASEHFNFAGLKWREEMRGTPGNSNGAATPVQYVAHDGADMYCKFASLINFIEGYWRFMDRSPYRGWRQHVDGPEAYIRFIGPIYCEANHNYSNLILANLEEMKELLHSFEGGAYRPAIDNSKVTGEATWLRIWDDDNGHVAEMAGVKLCRLYETGGSIKNLQGILATTKAGTYTVVSRSKFPIPEAEYLVEVTQPESNDVDREYDLSGLKVALDVGHGQQKVWKKAIRKWVDISDPGACNETEGIKEHELNWTAAQEAKKALETMGAKVDLFVYHTPGEYLKLTEKGAKAEGRDLFVSFHHNSDDDPNAQGIEVLIEDDCCTESDKKLAKYIQSQMLSELQLKDRTKGVGYKQQELGVLTGAHGKCKAKCLVECYFISHKDLTQAVANEWTLRAGRATAIGVAEYWTRNS